jgi:hypothetical protein
MPATLYLLREGQRRICAVPTMTQVNVEGGHASLCPPDIYILPPHRHARACPAHPRLTFFAGDEDVDGRVKPGHDGADVAGDAGGTDLPVVSSRAGKNISLFHPVETAIEPIPSRAHQEGRYASSRTWSAGCDGR